MAQKILKGGKVIESTFRFVKPIKSANAQEARRNVLSTYKLYMKNLPTILHSYEGLTRSRYEFKVAIKRLFTKNAHIRDLRTIDRMVNEASIEIRELEDTITPSYTIMNRLFQENREPKPTDFLSKFFIGKN